MWAASGMLTAGVRNLRVAGGIGGLEMIKAISTGIQRSIDDRAILQPGTSLSLWQEMAMGLFSMTKAAEIGGLFDREMERQVARYQAMVEPARQRLNAAVSRLRTDSDRRLARAADRLAAAGASYADKASARPRRFKVVEAAYERRLREFREITEPRRKRRLLRRRLN
jgi:hypothetical protein